MPLATGSRLRPAPRRLTATTAALALAGTAVVLMGQASPGSGLEAAADTATRTARGTAPDLGDHHDQVHGPLVQSRTR